MKKQQLTLLSFLLCTIIKAQNWISINQTNGLIQNDVRTIKIDNVGNKWVGTYGGGISKFDGVNWINYSFNDGLVCDYVRALEFDNNGNLWVGTDGGVSKFDGNNWVNYTTFDGLSNNLVYAIQIDSMGNKWFGTNMGVSKFDGVTWKTITTADGLSSNIITAIAIDNSKAIWFGSWGVGVTKFDGTNWTIFSQPNYVNAIVPELSGDIWFGTAQGIKKYDGTNWTSYAVSDGLVANNISAILVDNEQNKWFCSNTNGISKFDGNSFTTYNLNNGLICNQVNSATREDNGNLWFATIDGISVLSNTITGVSKNNQQQHLSIYPNPANQEIKLNLSSEFKETNYKILNNLGQIVMCGKISNTNNKISIDNIAPGIYFVQFGDGDVVKYRFVKT